jgi:hypothetical protein
MGCGALNTQEIVEMETGDQKQPLALAKAQQLIRADFLRFAEICMGQVSLPKKYGFAHHPGWNLEHELTWNMGCAVRSSEGGLSIHGGLLTSDDKDASQIKLEIRYFHPSIVIANGKKGTFTSRAYNDEYAVTLWADQGRPFYGMHRSLLGEARYLKAPTIEVLGTAVVTRLRSALAQPFADLAIHG